MSDVREIRDVLLDIRNQTGSSTDLLKELQTRSSDVVRASLSTWQNAYEYAKDLTNPDRTELLEIYETIEIDTHVSAVTETMYQGIASMDFAIKNANNEDDEELAKLFNASWFKDWVAMAVESIFWGFSGIQYGTVEDGKFTSIDGIPRYNIRPKQNGIATNQNRDKADIFFDEQPYKQWTTLFFPRMFGDQYQLGKYNKIAKWFILKREVTQFWAIFNELFGQPYRVAKTAVKDKTRKQNAINAMASMVSASFSVIDIDDEIEFISPTTGNGYLTFKEFIEMADKQISKALIGSTMVLDDGSSRSQGEVHQNNTNSFIVAYSRMIEGFVNDELIPKMVDLGFPISKENRFVYEEIEKISKKEWSEIIKNLSINFNVDSEFVTNTLGVPVEEKEEVEQVDSNVKDVDLENKSFFKIFNSNKIKDFYKSKFK